MSKIVRYACKEGGSGDCTSHHDDVEVRSHLEQAWLRTFRGEDVIDEVFSLCLDLKTTMVMMSVRYLSTHEQIRP